ncbi:MAG: MATE family efflux transporter [Planctomycetota bacterium]
MTQNDPESHRRPPHDAAAAQDASLEPDAVEEGIAGPREVGHSAGAPQLGRKSPGLTDDGRFRSGRLKGLTMGSAIFLLAWPVTVESFLNSAVGLTDTWLASQMGVAEADAIAGASYIMWFIGLTVMALGVGATALISRSVGASRMAVANAVLGQSVVLALVLGSAVGVFIAVAASWVADLLNMGPEATAAFEQYMFIIAMGVPASSILFVLIACARGAGDSIRPLQAMAVRNIVNIAVSWALSGIDLTVAAVDGSVRTILENPFGFDMGIAGIAIGTVAGDIAGAAIVFRMSLSGKWGITLFRRRLKPHWITVMRLVRLGVPNFLETLGMWVGNFIVIIFVGWMGAGLLGAHMIAIRIEAMSFLPGFAMGIAAATLAGQYLGARRPDLAKKAIMRCALIAAVIMGGLGALFITIPETLTGLISTQEIHLEQTPHLLVICGVVQIPFALGIVLRQAMRGAGDVKVVMALTWISTYLIRLPLAFFLSGVDIVWTREVDGELVRTVLLENPSPLEWGLTGLWVGLCIDLFMRGALFTGRFIHGGWMKAKV